LDLELERAGFACAALCERARLHGKICRQGGRASLPHDGVRTFGSDTVHAPNLFVGAFPCQDAFESREDFRSTHGLRGRVAFCISSHRNHEIVETRGVDRRRPLWGP
jgi:hypothetical protein